MIEKTRMNINSSKLGYIVFKPVFYVYDEYIENKELVDEMCYDKLVFSDIICLVTPEHFGESTIKRINQAKKLKKELLIFDGEKSFKYNDILFKNKIRGGKNGK